MPRYCASSSIEQRGEGPFFDVLRSAINLATATEMYEDRPGFPEEKHGVFIDKGPYEGKKAMWLGQPGPRR